MGWGRGGGVIELYHPAQFHANKFKIHLHLLFFISYPKNLRVPIGTKQMLRKDINVNNRLDTYNAPLLDNLYK